MSKKVTKLYDGEQPVRQEARQVPKKDKINEEIAYTAYEKLWFSNCHVLKPVLILQCELYHWADVLDICDEVLERACKKENDSQWILPCDLPQNGKVIISRLKKCYNITFNGEINMY